MFIRTTAALAAAGLTAGASAQWPTDPSTNLAVAAQTGGQLTPQIDGAPDGSCWVGWFTPESGNLNLRVQRLDADGTPSFGAAGLLVSDHPQNSALFGWDLMVDSTGGVVVVFSDERDGGDLDVHAYRIAPDGTFTWGPDGVTLSSNGDFEPAPRVTEATDGDFVVVWARLGATAELLMQRLSPAGAPQLAAGGVSIASAPGESPAFADLVPADNGSVIVSWMRDITTFASPRHLRAQKYDTNGNPRWQAGAPVEVFDATSVAIAQFTELLPDGAGGAVLAWYRPVGLGFEAAVQRLTITGAEVFPHNGVEVSTQASVGKLSPSIVYDPATQSIIAAFQVKNFNQDNWGVSAQKIDATGARQWTNDGRVIAPLDAVEKVFIRAAAAPDGAVLFWFDDPTMSVVDARVVGQRLDANGDPQWAPDPVVVASTLSGKDDLEVALAGDCAVMSWQDDRTDAGDVYAQAVCLDGSLGPIDADCPGDTDGNDVIDIDDVVNVVLDFGCVDPPGPCPGDVDGSGVVDIDDVIFVVLLFGNTCP